MAGSSEPPATAGANMLIKKEQGDYLLYSLLVGIICLIGTAPKHTAEIIHCYHCENAED